MGWLSMPLSSMFPHTGPKAYLDAQFTYDNRDADGKGKALRVIASSCLRNKVWYAAVVPSTDGTDEPAFAAVCLVSWNPRAKDGFVFAYKDMTEHAGPCEAECPEQREPPPVPAEGELDVLARGAPGLDEGVGLDGEVAGHGRGRGGASLRRDGDIVDQPELAGFHQQVEIVFAEA